LLSLLGGIDRSIDKDIPSLRDFTYQTDVKGFLNFPWGTTKEAVIAGMGQEIYSDEGKQLIFLGVDKYLGYDYAIGFNFEDNKLISAGYIILEEFKTPIEIWDASQVIRRNVNKQYGEAKLTIVNQNLIEYNWFLPSTKIRLMITVKRGILVFGLTYFDRRFIE